jgi:hypothetical protein
MEGGDDESYEAQSGCCTFVPRKNNMKTGLKRLELSHSQKNKWEDDWAQYWFYAKICFPNPEKPGVVFYLMAVKVLPFEHTHQPGFNKRLPDFVSCVSAFETASRVCGGRDLVEEYLEARIWPLTSGWFPVRSHHVKFDCVDWEVAFPIFGLSKPEGKSDEVIVAELEMAASELLGPWNKKEYDSFIAVCCRQGHVREPLLA